VDTTITRFAQPSIRRPSQHRPSGAFPLQADWERDLLERHQRQLTKIVSEYEEKCVTLQKALTNGVDEYARAHTEVQSIFNRLGAECNPQAVKKMQVELSTANRTILKLQVEAEHLRDLVDPFVKRPEVKYIQRLGDLDQGAFASIEEQFETWENAEPDPVRKEIFRRAKELARAASEHAESMKYWAEGELAITHG
jgi:hypothetical protein